MALEDMVFAMREKAVEAGNPPVPDQLMGVSKDRIEAVLGHIDRLTNDQRDAIFALLDDRQPSWYTKAKAGLRFCDGASTAHIACHVGILQRGQRKLDREGRDYWLKPMWELGAINKVYFDSNTRDFIPGHPVAKSSNCAYVLAPEFRDILLAPEESWQTLLNIWIKADKVRQRLELQARLAEEALSSVDTKHADLIKACIEHYVPHFLPSYAIVYVDDSDGDRISDEEKRILDKAGIEITLDDSMPDILLWDSGEDSLWVIEAVTSDGEADMHKVRNLLMLSERSGKRAIGFTTAYPTWKIAASRQGKVKNLAPNTYLWIREDPSKQFLASEYPMS